jgi:hypothetical protein
MLPSFSDKKSNLEKYQSSISLFFTDGSQSSSRQCQPSGDPRRVGFRPQQVGQLGARQHREESGQGFRTGKFIK